MSGESLWIQTEAQGCTIRSDTRYCALHCDPLQDAVHCAMTGEPLKDLKGISRVL